MNELKLSKEIYHIEHIMFAVQQYKDLCDIVIDDDDTDKYYKCIFLNCRYDVGETISEFENYLIDLMNTGMTV